MAPAAREDACTAAPAKPDAPLPVEKKKDAKAPRRKPLRKNIRCARCPRKYHTPRDLALHILAAHGELRQPDSALSDAESVTGDSGDGEDARAHRREEGGKSRARGRKRPQDAVVAGSTDTRETRPRGVGVRRPGLHPKIVKSVPIVDRTMPFVELDFVNVV